MNRTIEWQRTGGKSHRVTITDYTRVATHPLMNIYNSLEYNRLMGTLGAQAAYNPAFSQLQQQVANASPAPLVGWGSPLTGLFGSWL